MRQFRLVLDSWAATLERCLDLEQTSKRPTAYFQVVCTRRQKRGFWGCCSLWIVWLSGVQAPCAFHSSLLLSWLRPAITQRCHVKIASHNRPDDYFATASISSQVSKALLRQSIAELGLKQIKTLNNKWTVCIHIWSYNVKHMPCD